MPNKLKGSDLQELELLNQKIQNFFDMKQAIHVKFKRGHFKNGYIKEIRSDFFIVDDFQDGEEFVFFLEIENVDTYKTIEKTNKRKLNKEAKQNEVS